jgi:hypothetical protein
VPCAGQGEQRALGRLARRKARSPPDSSIFRASCATAGGMIVPGASRRAVFGAWCCIVLSSCGRDQTTLASLPPALGSLVSNAGSGVASTAPGSGAPGGGAPGSGGNSVASTAPGSAAAGGVAPAGVAEGVVPGSAANGGADGEAPAADTLLAGAAEAEPSPAGAGDAARTPASGVSAPCGAEGQACCAEAGSCEALLDCVDGLCVECARFFAIPAPAGLPPSGLSRVSGDGRVVVVDGGASQAYRMVWRSNQAPLLLPPLAGDAQSAVTGVSRDGSIAVGESSGPAGRHAVLWSKDAVATSLAPLELASGVSAAGDVVIGGDPEGPVRWSAQGTTRLASVDAASDVSADGRSFVGTKQSEAGLDRAVLDAGDGGTFAGVPGELLSSGTLISGDSSTLVGTSIDRLAQADIFRRRGAVTEPLVGLAEAQDINADGSIVVGLALGEECGGGTGLWRQGRGTEHLECILPPGTLPEAWRLLRATGVSDDGRVISGIGINPEATLQSWVAVLGPACVGP